MTINRTVHVALAALAILCCGCGKEEEPAADPYDTQYSRMRDPEYVASIKASLDERKALMTEATKVAEALEAEKARDPQSPKIAELEAERAKISEKIRQQRIRTSVMVRDRMEKEQQAIKAREEKENLKKGNN